jgi:hypothetical protein
MTQTPAVPNVYTDDSSLPQIQYELNSSVAGRSSSLDAHMLALPTGSPAVSQSAAPWQDDSTDAAHGLVHGATLRFSDSPALRLRRRAMVVWEQVRHAV